jgi:hypothetical protein
MRRAVFVSLTRRLASRFARPSQLPSCSASRTVNRGACATESNVRSGRWPRADLPMTRITGERGYASGGVIASRSQLDHLFAKP